MHYLMMRHNDYCSSDSEDKSLALRRSVLTVLSTRFATGAKFTLRDSVSRLFNALSPRTVTKTPRFAPETHPHCLNCSNHKSCSGFTLIEMLLAIALLSIVLVALYGTFFVSQKAIEGADDALVRLQEGRMAIDTIRRELDSA